MAFKHIIYGFLALAFATAAAQERGMWRATSKTAQSVTGDIAFSDEKLSINFAVFTIAQIRELTPAEIAAGFDGATGGSGNLFRLSIPADKRFLHKNTLCGGEETQWVATRFGQEPADRVLFRRLDAGVYAGGHLHHNQPLRHVFLCEVEGPPSPLFIAKSSKH